MKKTSREKILVASMKVFGEKEYENTTMDMIAKSMKIAKGTLYLYFKSKEELFIDVMGYIMKKYEEVVCEAEKYTDSDPKVKLRRLINSTLVFIEKNEKFYYMLERQMQNIGKSFSEKHFRKMYEGRNKVTGVFCGLIEEGIEKGLIRKIKPEICAMLLMTMIMSFSRMDLFTTDEEVIKGKSEEILNIFLKGVGK